MSFMKKSPSRREFVQGIATGAAGLAAAGYLGGAKLAAQPQQAKNGLAGGPADVTPPAKKGSAEKITVLNPLGVPPAVRLKAQARRLDTLEGKTVYLVNDGFPGSDNVLYEMLDWFKANYPKTTVLYKYGSVAESVGKTGRWKTPLRGKVQKRDFPPPLGNPARAAGFPLFPPPRRRGLTF